ncbi:MAG: cation:dicarboxylase symporter family transporter [Rickettsiaceae bacterium]|nr:cation:dicarboxylase symporter family transporter [Rickettsiaceae bacterium]
MFYKIPVILVAIIIAVICLDPILPFIIKQILYSISSTIKEMIVFLLPLVILSLLFKAAVMLSKNATKIISVILILVCISNFTVTFLSHYVGVWVYNFDLSILKPANLGELVPLWIIEFPKLIANDKAMFIGIVLGLITSKFQPEKSLIIAKKLEIIINKILSSFVYFMPLFIAGFVVKLQHDEVIEFIVKDYTIIFILIAITQLSYVMIAYFILSNLKIRNFLITIKNILPAAISGFTSMSSAASMPLTIVGAENNAQNKDLARSVIPATVNIHLIGDCFAIPILAFAILKSFGMPEPSLLCYLTFAFYFVIAKFSVAAIPGGGIIVMLPILETYLGFNGEMMSLITSLYILFDPVITGTNVLGNGAFAKMIDNLLRKF